MGKNLDGNQSVLTRRTTSVVASFIFIFALLSPKFSQASYASNLRKLKYQSQVYRSGRAFYRYAVALTQHPNWPSSEPLRQEVYDLLLKSVRENYHLSAYKLAQLGTEALSAEMNLTAVRLYYQVAANHPHLPAYEKGQAEYKIALYFQGEVGESPNEIQAEHYFLRALSHGVSSAHYYLGVIYGRRYPNSTDEIKQKFLNLAIHHFRESMKHEKTDAQAWLGLLLICTLEEVPGNFELAREHLLQYTQHLRDNAHLNFQKASDIPRFRFLLAAMQEARPRREVPEPAYTYHTLVFSYGFPPAFEKYEHSLQKRYGSLQGRNLAIKEYRDFLTGPLRVMLPDDVRERIERRYQQIESLEVLWFTEEDPAEI